MASTSRSEVSELNSVPAKIFIGLEGYVLPKRFIVKELYMMYPNGQSDHYLFKTPERNTLSDIDRQTIHYAVKYLNNLCYKYGEVETSSLPVILERVKDEVLYTYGDGAVKFLRGFLPETGIINVQDMGYKMPGTLPDPDCGIWG